MGFSRFFTGLLLTLVSASVLAQAQIGVAKDVSSLGREVTYTFYLENLGTEDLTNISLPDDLDAAFGSGNYVVISGPSLVSGPITIVPNGGFDGSSDTELIASGSLLVGQQAVIVLVVEITTVVDLGMGLGVYSNQVTAAAEDGMATPTNDLSDHGQDPDPNGNGDPGDAGEDDPTILDLLANPVIGAAKAALVSGTQVTFDLTLEAFGNVNLSDVQVIDDLDSVFGAGNYAVIGAPMIVSGGGLANANGAFDGSGDPNLFQPGSQLLLGNMLRLQFVVDVTNVTDQGLGLGVYQNQVNASATGGGKTDTDLSTEGLDPDPNGDGSPAEALVTNVVLGEEPVIGVAKTAMVNASAVTFDIYLENLGNVMLQELDVTDDLNAALGVGNYFVDSVVLIDDPGTLTLNPGYDGNFDTQLLDVANSTLAMADTAQIQVQVQVVTLSDQGLGLGIYENQAFVQAFAPGGGFTSDSSDDGTDPDPNANGQPNEAGENDATAFSIATISEIGIAKEYISGGIVGGFPTVILQFTITNYGNQALSSITVSDDLNMVYGAGNFIHMLDPEYVSGSPTLTYNSGFNGSGNTSMITNGTLLPGDSTVFRIASWVINITDQGFGAGIYQNQVTVIALDPLANPVSDQSHEGNDPDPNGNGDPTEAGENDPTVIDVNGQGVIGIAKDVAVAGNQVTFDLYLESLGDIGVLNLDITEQFDLVFGSGNWTLSVAPFFVDDPGTIVLNPGFNGLNDFDLLDISNASLAAGDTAQIRYEVTVLNIANQGLGLGNYSTQNEVRGFDQLGAQVSDLSDNGTDPDPDGDDQPNEAGENDATPISLTVDSPVGVAKTAMVANFQVTIDLYLENLGSGNLANVQLQDSLADTFGSGNYSIITPPSFIVDPGTLTLNGAFNGDTDAQILDASSTLNAGATAQIQLVVSVDQESDQGFGFGVYENQASASGTQTNGITVSDVSDEGTDPDPNGNNDPGDAGEDDPTPIVITGNPAIGVAFNTTVSGTLVTYDLYVENLGDVTLTNILMQNPINPVYGSGNFSVTQAPTLVSGPGTILRSPNYFGFSVFDFILVGGSLRPGEVEHLRFAVNVTNVTDQGNGIGVYLDGATVTATDPGGNPVIDETDEGTDPDPNGNGNANEMGENDLNTIIIGDEARLGVAKTATVVAQQVTFDIYLENLGGSTMSALSLTENLDTVFGAGNYSLNGAPSFVDDPGTINLNPGFDGSATTELMGAGSTLAAMDTAQIRVVVDVTTVSNQGAGFGNYVNQVTVSGTAPLGTPFTDISDSGTDPDPNSNGLPNDGDEDDPTQFFVGFTSVGAAKNATVNSRLVTLDYYVENLGTTEFSNVTLADDLDAVFGAGNFTLISGPDLISPPRDVVPNVNFDGSNDTDLIASGALGLGVTDQIRIVVEVLTLTDQGSGLGIYSNQVTVNADGFMDLSDDGVDPDPNGNDQAGDAGEDDPTVFTMPQEPVVGIAKTASVNGRLVTMDLFFESFANTDVSNLDIAEDLDAVFGAGNYSILSAPALIVDPGTVTLNPGFNGGGDTSIFNAGASTLAQGATGQIRFTIEVTTVTDQGSGLGVFSNQATVSGQSQDATLYSDLSDNGTDSDPDGDGNPNEAGENDATSIVLQANIGDTVFTDLDGNGVQNGAEAGRPLVTVYLDTNNNGTQDGGEPATVTDGNGNYEFLNLAAGTYNVRVDESGIPAGFVLTGGSNPNMRTVFAGENATDVDFGYQQQDASIGELVFNDLDGDGFRDAGEPGLAGVVVYLDLNTNGVFDGGEPFETTDATGFYDITDLPTGVYLVRVDNATVSNGFVLTTGNLPLMENLAAGEDFNNATFGYQQQDASIGDFVWNDLNGDGVQDGGEPGLDGITVFLDINSNGVLDGGEPSTATAGGGAYDFQNLPTGNYDLTVDAATVPVGFVLTGGSNPLTVPLAAGEDFNNGDLGYQQQDASIGDFVWDDLNGDGVQNGGEPGLDGVVVYLDLNTNGIADGGEPQQTTAGGGAYDFTNLALGTYSVQVDLSTVPITYDLTTANLPQSVPLVAGEDFNDADFGFQVQPEPGFGKAFSVDPFAIPDGVTLTFTIDNTASTLDATGLDFTDNLPADMTVATPANASTTCTGGTLTAPDGASVITYTGGTLGAGATCTVTVDIAVATPGAYLNTSGDLTSSLGNSGPAVDSVTASPPPGFSKTFTPASIAQNGISTLDFVIDNSGSTQAATALSFVDNLPAGVTVATPPNASTTCTGGTLTANAGAGSVSYTSGTVAAASMCMVSVDVTAANVGVYPNTTEDLTSNLGNSGTASATLAVDPPLGFSKAFAQATVPLNTDVTLTFTLDNTGSSQDATAVQFVDNLPADMEVASPNNASTNCAAGAITAVPATNVVSFAGGTVTAGTSCTIVVDVVPTNTGIFDNITDPLTSNLGNSGTASSSLNVPPPDDLTFGKAFLSAPTIPGGDIQLQYTIENSSAIYTADQVAFSDDLDAVLAGVTQVGMATFSGCGGSAALNGAGVLAFSGGQIAPNSTCTIDATVRIPGTAAEGVFISTSSTLSYMVASAALTAPPATDTFAVAYLQFSKTFLSDATAGGNVALSFTIANPDPTNNATGVEFTDDLTQMGLDITAIDTPLLGICGPGSSLTGVSLLTFTGGTVPAGGQCTFEVVLTVASSGVVGQYENVTSPLSSTINGVLFVGDPADTANAILQISGRIYPVPALHAWALLILGMGMVFSAWRRKQHGQ